MQDDEQTHFQTLGRSHAGLSGNPAMISADELGGMMKS